MFKLPPQDKLLNTINVNDDVVFGKAGSMTLHTGKVIKINAKTVTIEHEEYNNSQYSTLTESRRAFKDVVVIPSSEIQQ